MKKVKAEDRFSLCSHIKYRFCSIKKHYIESGIASKYHCKNCNSFNQRGRRIIHTLKT